MGAALDIKTYLRRQIVKKHAEMQRNLIMAKELIELSQANGNDQNWLREARHVIDEACKKNDSIKEMKKRLDMY